MLISSHDIRYRWLPNTMLAVAVVLMGIAGAFLVSEVGLVVVALAAAVLMTMLLLLIGTRFWLVLVALILTGYMFASRGFAGVGFYPVYIGEAVLALGCLTLVLTPFSQKIQFQGLKRFLSVEFLLLAAFFVWSVIQTAPYFPEYQFDTLRDAMIFGYAIFTVLIMALVPRRWIDRFFNYYGRIMPFALVWFPIFFFVSRFNAFPIYFPGSQFPLLYTKGSDVGVHLAGVGAFLLLALEGRHHSRPVTWFLWLYWVATALIYGSFGRAVLLAAGVSLGVVFMIRPIHSRWDRPLLIAAIGLCVLLATGTYSTLRIDIGAQREISPQQLVENFTSIFGSVENESEGLEGTKQWRLRWWGSIVDYTFNGPFFWTGKGYGVNLASSDGFQVQEDESLRSPHNGHMTILARSGVPGYVLWVGFLAAYAIRLVRFVLVNQNKRPTESRYVTWLLAYLAAFVLMTAFDVFLEGPMGGIWFWALVGMGFVYTSSDPKDRAQSLHEPQPDAQTGA